MATAAVAAAWGSKPRRWGGGGAGAERNELGGVRGDGRRLRSGEVLGEAEAPRVAWSYWDKGFESLSDFRKLCLETWRVMNPAWEVILLDSVCLWEYVDAQDLPRQWKDMYVAFQADAVRLALLARYGGLWIDVATICVQPFDRWLYTAIRDDGRPEGIGAFYFSSWGVEQGRSAEYVENWLLAARRGHPMILRWKALFCDFWNSVVPGSLDLLGLPDHPMFCDVDLSHMQRFGQDMRSYLVMHSCFKKMIDQEVDMRHIWLKEMLLLRADDHGLWHLDEPGVVWNVPAALQKWLQCCDEAWVRQVLGRCFVLKFTKQFASLLDSEPKETYLAACGGPRTSISEVFQAVFAFELAD